MTKTFSILLIVLVVSLGLFLNAASPDSAPFEAKPQTPQAPFAYHREPIELQSASDNARLSGELTLPYGPGPFPAVILLSVAGPNDRDQSFAGHKGFFVLADSLAKRGFAVVRFDDRGVGGSTGNYFDVGWDALGDDANQFFERLRKDPRIDASKIGFAGMSQGGAVAAIAARQNTETAFIVLMSAPGLSGEETLRLQLEKTLSLLNADKSQSEKYFDLFETFVTLVKNDTSDPATKQNLIEFLSGPGKALIPPYQFFPKTAEAQAEIFLNAWYQSNILFDPQAVYRGLDLPILAIGGAMVIVAPPEAHLKSIANELRAGTMDNVTIHKFENLNHLLQDAKTGLPNEYAKLKSSLSPSVLELIGEWIEEQVSSPQA